MRSASMASPADENTVVQRSKRFASVTVTGAAARLQCREFGAVVDVPIPKAAP
jgi:DNA-binding sugar fermentation-stimulating protein